MSPLILSLLLSAAPPANALASAGQDGAAPVPASQQTGAVPQDSAPPASADGEKAPADADADADPDLDIDPAEPDFDVIVLPTNARVPRHKMTFQLTHRFARDLGDGGFSDLLADFFGFDGGAQVGLGLRYGLFRGTRLGLYRTSDRTIVWRAQQELLRETGAPVGVSLLASVEGRNNFGLSEAASAAERHEFSPSVGVLVSRRLGSRGAVYVSPAWVGRTRIEPSAPGDDDHTLVLGLGARLRVTKTMSVVGEMHPRLAGYAGDLGSGDPDPLASFGVEWRVGGHAFQFNVSNALGTTPAQVARGAQGASGWFIGFNLTRKFY
jgi:hypothetical protein